MPELEVTRARVVDLGGEQNVAAAPPEPPPEDQQPPDKQDAAPSTRPGDDFDILANEQDTQIVDESADQYERVNPDEPPPGGTDDEEAERAAKAAGDGKPKPDEKAETTDDGKQEAAAEDGKQADEKGGRAKSKQDRYDEAHRRAQTAEAALTRANAENAALNQRLARIEQQIAQGGPPAQQQVPPTRAPDASSAQGASGAVQPQAREPKPMPDYSDFDNPEDYNRAMRGWHESEVGAAKQEVTTAVQQQATQQAAQDSAIAAEQATTQARYNEAVQLDPELPQNLNALNAVRSPYTNDPANKPLIVTPFLFRNGQKGAAFLSWASRNPTAVQQLENLPPSDVVWPAVLSAENTDLVAEYFATPEGIGVFNQLAALQNPGQVYAAMGRLDATLAARKATAAADNGGPAQPKPKDDVTAAPPPSTPPGGKGSAANRAPATMPDDNELGSVVGYINGEDQRWGMDRRAGHMMPSGQ